MTPYWHDPFLTVYEGDCREVMAQMEPESVHTVVTSPPYWGLRDYGIDERGIGLEPTPEAYVENMVAVFREVKRVLRKDGTCWVNLGDSYSSGFGEAGSVNEHWGNAVGQRKQEHPTHRDPYKGLPPKNLVGIPWRVAFALQADGWYLRSDIIWSKPNPMPESVTDRPTKAHEYLFLLSKSPRYYYDADAVREPAEYGRREQPAATWDRLGTADKDAVRVIGSTSGGDPSAGRNLRSVWSIATQPYPGAHFATFPEALVEPCVKAGTSERGVCPECGAPWVREVERGELLPSTSLNTRPESGKHDLGDAAAAKYYGSDGMIPGASYARTTTGWCASCGHLGRPVAATVLDPFAGSGTTGRVAQRLGRRAVLIDLSGEYLTQAMKRNQDIPLGLETA